MLVAVRVRFPYGLRTSILNDAKNLQIKHLQVFFIDIKTLKYASNLPNQRGDCFAKSSQSRIDCDTLQYATSCQLRDTNYGPRCKGEWLNANCQLPSLNCEPPTFMDVL
jgi:hypothetical protein